MTEIILGINNCFAIGRYPETEEWLNIVKNELELNNVQFSFDLLDPIIMEHDVFTHNCKQIKKEADSYGVSIDTAITGEVPHKSNALLDPDPAKRNCYLKWYEKLMYGAGLMGAEASGVYMGTMSKKDNENPTRRNFLIQVLMEEISHLTSIAKACGHDYFLWEPMSVPREIPCTINETKKLIERVNKTSHIPVMLCLDVGHGYINSGDPRDANAYEWLKEFKNISPVIHMQQTDGKGSRHWPFSDEYNKMGIIIPEKIFEIIEESELDKVMIAFEFFYSAHAISEESALENLKISVDYWKKAISRVYK